MFELFYQYLFLNKKASIQGVGTFYISRSSAQLNFSSKTIIAPVWQISFTKGEVPADKAFYSFIANEQSIDEMEALKKVNDFIFDLKREFSVYKKLELPKIGLLTETVKGEYFLKSDNYLYRYYPDATAERIIRENGDKSVFENMTPYQPVPAMKAQEEDVEIIARRQDWWIDAVILAVLAIAAIVYYYLQNGSFH